MINRKFRLGFIVNPYSGIGGALALKGSDGPEVRAKALAQGAILQSAKRASTCLKEFENHKDNVVLLCAGADMGEDLARSHGFATEVVYRAEHQQTEDTDSASAAQAMLDNNVDMILFAGGDGTARNIYDVVGAKCPVVGIPAGCKIHSGVYAITPSAAGRVVEQVLSGELVSLMNAEVRDIDESAFRDGKVIAKHYGEMQVPNELSYIQAVKMGGKESDELVLADIAAEIIDDMQDNPDCIYVMGSGSTVDSIMQDLGLANTLLGVDVIQNQALVASDVTAQQLLQLTENHGVKLVVTLIGGQGHVFGRGNQQLSAQWLSQIDKRNILIVATKTKLKHLEGRPLIADTGDVELDKHLSGPIAVITGYRDRVLYQFA